MKRDDATNQIDLPRRELQAVGELRLQTWMVFTPVGWALGLNHQVVERIAHIHVGS